MENTKRARAAVCHSFGAPLSVDEVLIAPPGRDEVRIRIEACAICHSDVAYADGAWGGDLPAVFGHEACGVVEEVGAGVGSPATGQRVIVGLVRSCGTCAAAATASRRSARAASGSTCRARSRPPEASRSGRAFVVARSQSW